MHLSVKVIKTEFIFFVNLKKDIMFGFPLERQKVLFIKLIVINYLFRPTDMTKKDHRFERFNR